MDGAKDLDADENVNISNRNPTASKDANKHRVTTKSKVYRSGLDRSSLMEEKKTSKRGLKSSLFLPVFSNKNKQIQALSQGSNAASTEGTVELNLGDKTREKFGLDEEDDEDDVKVVPKGMILEDLEENPESDFTPLKEHIKDLPDDVFLVMDPSDISRYIVPVSPDAILKIKEVEEEGEESEEMALEPIVAHPWISLGSEKEVDAQVVEGSRDLIRISMKRDKEYFDQPTQFSKEVGDVRMVVDIPSSEDKVFEGVLRMELDAGVQAVPKLEDVGTQKQQGVLKNKICQYEAREMTNEKAEAEMESQSMALFLNKVIPIMKRSLQQNQILDVFYDDWGGLFKEGDVIISRADYHFKEYQSYNDLQSGKTYSVSCIECHPGHNDVIAVSMIENMTYYELMGHAKKQATQAYLILFWNLADPINPILRLEAPEQILTFQFCPTNPSFLAAGCFSGQVAMFDLTCFRDRLKNGPNNKKKNKFKLPKELDTEQFLEVARYCAVSSIEQSHKVPVNHVQWLPHQYETTKNGTTMLTKYENCFQLITCSVDLSILFWDIRTIKGKIPTDTKKDMVVSKEYYINPPTFKHLDHIWKPFLKLSTIKGEMGKDYSPVMFLCMRRKEVEEESDDGTERRGPDNTMLFIGTDDGDVLYVDWCPVKDQESGKYQAQKPVFTFSVHSGPIVALDRHPHLEDLVLSVGGWNFAIWSVTFVHGPVFLSGFSSRHYTGGCWSPNKSSVFFLIKIDGSLDVWNLLDRTHEPIHTQTISTSQITTIIPVHIQKHSSHIAVGDTSGSLHILELPSCLSASSNNDTANMAAYMRTEMNRVMYMMERRGLREDAANDMPLIKVDRKSVLKKSNLQMKGSKVKEEKEEESEYDKFLELEREFKEALAIS